MKTSALLLAAAATAATAAQPLAAQDGAEDPFQPTGVFYLGAAQSARSGPTLQVGIEESNLFGRGFGLDARAEVNDDGYRAALDLDVEIDLAIAGLAGAPRLDFGVTLSDQEWQDSAFQSRERGVDVGLVLPWTTEFSTRTGVFFVSKELADVAPQTSPIVAAEAGWRDSVGLSLGLDYVRLDNPFRPRRGVTLGLGAEISGLGGDTDLGVLTGNATVYRPLPADAVISFSLSAGAIEGRDGDASRILDRAFLGYDLPRGFDYGGLGPRDKAGVTNTSLGGDRYAALSIEATVPVYDNGSSQVLAGVFWDGGSVWSLPVTSGGAQGVIDDSRIWRASAGISLGWTGRFGEISLSLAEAYDRQQEDETRLVSIGFRTQF